MTKTLPPIVFFGSGPVAAASLEHLAKHFPIEAVVTKPRAEGHRGSVPVLELAHKLDLPLHTPKNRRELDALLTQTHFHSACGIVVDYGIIMSKMVIESFPKGIVNSHFSLLPQWRGADPITFAILSGQPQTGVSLMLIVEALDEGDLLAQEELSITPEMTTPELTKALVDLSNRMLVEFVPRYLDGEITPHPQPSQPPVSYSRRLSKEDGTLDWSKPAAVLEREVRAFTNWPQTKGKLILPSGKEMEVLVTKAATAKAQLAPGHVAQTSGRLLVGTSEDAFEILRLKVPGKKEITAGDFIRGYLR